MKRPTAPAALTAVVACLFLLQMPAARAAGRAPLILEHLTAADGLPQATVMASLQDSQGFVWLGTEDGLVRYDGRELRRYGNSPRDPNSLPGQFIWDIAEDARHDLWIAIRNGGLARWHRDTDRFSVYRHGTDPGSLASDNVRAVLVDPRGRIWAATMDAGVDVLDPATGVIEHLRHDPRNPDSLGSDEIVTLAAARDGGVWIGTEAGLDRWDPARRRVTRFGQKLRARVMRVLEDRAGTLWVATLEQGLLRFAADGTLLESYRHAPAVASSLPSDDVRALLEDAEGRLWVGTAKGLELLDRASRTFTHYAHDAGDPASLRDSFIMSLYQDPDGLVWIGTRTGGVSRWNPRSWLLGTHQPEWLGTEPVNAFADGPGGVLWVASLRAGLVLYDPDSRAVVTDARARAAAALSDARVMSLQRDARGRLWIGTMAHGLKSLDADGQLRSIAVGPGDARSTSAAGIMSLLQSRSGELWIGTYGGGANVLDPVTGRVRQLPVGAADGLPGPNVTAIAEDAHGNLWLGTDANGLALLRPDGSVAQVFAHDAADPDSLPDDSIYALTVDAAGTVWIGMEAGGLARVHGDAARPQSLRFERFGLEDGLFNTIYGIVADSNGLLWLSGNTGLVRFDPVTHEARAFHREHGLQGEEFSFGAHQRLADGRIAFGGPGGFNLFDPARLEVRRPAPRVALTGLSIMGVSQQGERPYWLPQDFSFGYRDNIVAFDFGVLDYASARNNRLAYRMQGLTDEWIDLGPQRRITLMNLEAGAHTLEVRAASPDSTWSATPLRVAIQRAPAPWRSTSAYVAYALFALLLVAERVRRQRRKFREIAAARDRLEAEVRLRTRELVASNQQLAEAARAKSDFLDRMSHELRTPMNGVIGMTELLTRTPLSGTQSHLTRTIRSSAQILLQIVNDLLDLSKIRAGRVTLERLPIDVAQVLEECTSLFAGAAEAKGVELIVCPPPAGAHELLGDPLRIRQVVMNLVGNAVKFTSQGEIAVRAEILPLDEGRASLSIAVTDTGIGMDAVAMGRIFEPFTQADETTTRRFGGTGLGLSICRELAELMQGRIAVASTPQVGSTFTLTLPVHLGEAVPAPALQLPPRAVRIFTRRASLHEALSRHVATAGLAVQEQDAEPQDADQPIHIIDAGSRRELLEQHLATPERGRPRLVAIATAADAEALGLRVLLDERLIVLKPLQRVALLDALAVASGAATATAHEATAEPQQAHGHVLVVEDEPVNAAVAQGYLAAIGCTSVWVRNGAEAVARSSVERFDLIFMDLNMPDMDGYAATGLIRRREAGQRRVPVIALTAHPAPTVRDRCLAADIDDVLSKPYPLEECARLLQRWLLPGAPAVVQPQDAVVAATVAPAVDELAAIDEATVATLRALRRGGASLYGELVGLFTSGSGEAMPALGAALARGDAAAAAAICHKLSASAANVGAPAFGAQLRSLERLCRAGDAVGAGHLYERLRAAHAPLLDALAARALEASA